MWPELRRAAHWGPLTALCIIKCVALSTLHLTFMWLPPHESLAGIANHLLFLSFVGLALYNLFSAMFIGPGYVPRNWKPQELSLEQADRCLQYCFVCEGYKAPRAHHCRKCGRCVLKMDHHCPWINNCCGHSNQAYFTLFLLSSVVGSIQAVFLLVVGLYRGYYNSWYYYNGKREHMVYLTLTSLMFGIFSIGLAVGVVVAVGGLLIIQMKVIIKNMTTIEDWIVIKAESRQRQPDDIFVYPYNLGLVHNFKQVFINRIGTGIYWPVIEGCNQYTLTIEQLLQKEEKRIRSRQYQVICNYNGSWFPLLSQGFKTCIKFPISDEPRIVLSPGDLINTTRWKKHWLYGEKVASSSVPFHARQRGWFPKKCVVEVIVSTCSTPAPSHSNSHLNSSNSKTSAYNKKLI